jgi:hypothetical protein
MVVHLGEILDSLPGATNQTHCCLHTLSISAKAILKQFDLPKGNNADLGVTAQAFADLTKELDIEE